MRHDPVADTDHGRLRSLQKYGHSHCLIRAGIGHRERDALTSLDSAPLSFDERLPELGGEDRRDSGALGNAGIACRLSDAVEVTGVPAANVNHAVAQVWLGVAE